MEDSDNGKNHGWSEHKVVIAGISGGQVEFVARTQEHIDALNRHLEIKSVMDAMRDWLFGH